MPAVQCLNVMQDVYLQYCLKVMEVVCFFSAIFERLRNILHESTIDKRVQYMIEVMFAIRKDGFKDHPVIPDGLDLVDEEDQFTHMMPLEDDYNTEDILSKTYNTVDTCITSLSFSV